MSRIKVLDPQTANSIKAGEVIERPVSVVKELVDNSIDAGSTRIRIEFENGGISLIRVTDNGIGMDPEDAEKCFLIHATSKITTIEDIYDLSTMGFRGEALASIGACSEVTLLTKMADQDEGTLIRYKDGCLQEIKEAPSDTGTVVTVKDLFANIPARYKFLKKDSTEGMYICGMVEKMAIVNPHIAFRLFKDGKEVFSTPGNGDMKDTIYSLYGKSVTEGLIPLEYENEGMKLRGFVSVPSTTRGNRGMQYVYVNDRNIKNTSVTAAIDEAYRNSVMKNRFPICFICIYVPSGGVDVNVHPRKEEVKFSNESDVFRLVYHGIKNALAAKDGMDSDAAFESVRQDREADKDSSLDMSSRSLKRTSYQPEQIRIDQSSLSATNDLLAILSGFKPDIEEISGQKAEEETSPEAVLPEAVDTDAKSAEYDVPARGDVIPSGTKEITGDLKELLNSEFKGFLFATYIIMQSDTCFFLVDQHAAHERVLYEKFMKKRKAQDSAASDVQDLLVPQIVELTAMDYSFVSDNLGRFRDEGFDIDPLGNNQIALRSIPLADKAASRLKSMDKPSVIFESILSSMKRDVPAKNSTWYSLIQTTACKAAIKAHDVISREEALELIGQLRDLEDPYHCAHGRPTFIRIEQTDLEKRFKRIV